MKPVIKRLVARPVLGLAPLLLITFAAWSEASGAPARAAPAAASDARGDAPPPESLRSYLGTWLYVETVELPDGRGATIEHYMLIKWHKEKFKVRTIDYLPDRRIWGRESSWQGTIRVDQWNVTKQSFTPMEDGTISVGFAGTNGVGNATTQAWWAAGRLQWKRDDAGELLHLVTTTGYSPSSKGNAWKPIDHTYRRLSEVVDPRIDRKQRR